MSEKVIKAILETADLSESASFRSTPIRLYRIFPF
jgi:hypothetical protein